LGLEFGALQKRAIYTFLAFTEPRVLIITGNNQLRKIMAYELPPLPYRKCVGTHIERRRWKFITTNIMRLCTNVNKAIAGKADWKRNQSKSLSVVWTPCRRHQRRGGAITAVVMRTLDVLENYWSERRRRAQRQLADDIKAVFGSFDLSKRN